MTSYAPLARRQKSETSAPQAPVARARNSRWAPPQRSSLQGGSWNAIPHTVALPHRSPQRADLHQAIEGGGTQLPSGVRGSAEALFSQDFSDVRVHQDSQAGRLNQELQAKALTVGRHVFMPPSVSHDTEDGQRLYLHELAHVAGNPLASSDVSLVQRAPAAAPTVSPDMEVLSGAMASLSMVAGTYAAVRNGNRRVEDAEVTERIGAIRDTLGTAQTLIFNKIPNPAALPDRYQALRALFQGAINQIVGASAQTTGRTTNEVYLKHENELPEWAMPRVDNANFSTPLPLDASLNAGQNRATLAVGGLAVVLLPDQTLAPGMTIPGSPKKSGATKFKFANRPGYSYKADASGHITSVTWNAAFTPTVTISTVYIASVVPATAQSAYGRGTTREDQAAGTTTLRFHEGNHGIDFIKFVRDNPYPVLPNGVGLTPADFAQQITAYDNAVSAYSTQMEAFSVGRTD